MHVLLSKVLEIILGFHLKTIYSFWGRSALSAQESLANARWIDSIDCLIDCLSEDKWRHLHECSVGSWVYGCIIARMRSYLTVSCSLQLFQGQSLFSWTMNCIYFSCLWESFFEFMKHLCFVLFCTHFLFSPRTIARIQDGIGRQNSDRHGSLARHREGDCTAAGRSRGHRLHHR